MKKAVLWIFIVFKFFNLYSAFGCTTAIISGKNTVDGRPLLLKHRDTRKLENKLMFFDDGKYEYIGLVNSEDSLGNEIWAGCNSMGFAIMNSASYNLNSHDTTSLKDREGYVMKQALQTCATLEDFEELLNSFPKPLGVEANFGVIDGNGGAAYYETGNYDFMKFDANDPAVAPFGFLIRTNYSFRGERADDKGLIRYRTAEELFNIASSMNRLSYKFLLQDVSRCLKHSLTGKDLTENIPQNSHRPVFVDFRDFIPRYSSAATVVVQGVKKDESPALTTMWTILGFQLSSVAIPTWVAGGKNLPLVLLADQSGRAPLCTFALKLKERIFPLTRGSYRYYINLAELLNRDKSGIMNKLAPVEDRIINEAGQKLKMWRETGIHPKQVRKFYQWVDETVKAAYRENFGLNWDTGK